MRLVALGTGGGLIPIGQANTGWLVELGSGAKFLIDFGFGTQINFAALDIPYRSLTAVFATDLHADHVGDFMQICQGGWIRGRDTPLVVYGPAGTQPSHGIRHFVEHQIRSLQWDRDLRLASLPPAGGEVIVHELDSRQSVTVTPAPGVTVTSFPAIHVRPGPVSLRLDWNGYCLVYSGDLSPSPCLAKYGVGADVLIYDAFPRCGSPPHAAADGAHAGLACPAGSSDPIDIGGVLALCRPRLAIGYHAFGDMVSLPRHVAGIRRHYDGALELARDLMVFEVTRTAITTRLSRRSLPSPVG